MITGSSRPAVTRQSLRQPELEDSLSKTKKEKSTLVSRTYSTTLNLTKHLTEQEGNNPTQALEAPWPFLPKLGFLLPKERKVSKPTGTQGQGLSVGLNPREPGTGNIKGLEIQCQLWLGLELALQPPPPPTCHIALSGPQLLRRPELKSCLGDLCEGCSWRNSILEAF